MDQLESREVENIAQTLARELPKPSVVLTQPAASDDEGITFVALPKGFKLEALDNEGLLEHPRRAKSTAALKDLDSFCAYVLRHRDEAATVVWCTFDPQTFALVFTAVFDDHASDVPGWRKHQATYSPSMSAEWKTWTGANKKPMPQVEFAEFLEANEPDIAAMEGYPTSLQMLGMAQEFVARQDQVLKSTVRLQNGGVNLTYVADADSGTTEAMKIFEKFAIGIPVFWTAPDAGETAAPIAAFRIDARLRYRQAQSKVSFHYELVRPDRVHQKAAVELIEAVRMRLESVPLMMGSCA